MKLTKPFPIPRRFSTGIQPKKPLPPLRPPKFPKQNAPFISEHICRQILDENPDIRTLERLHSKLIFHRTLRSNPYIGIKLMTAYATCGQPSISHHVFDEMTDKNVVVFNRLIRSYVDNHLYHEALLVYKSKSSYDINPDHYTFPCLLKACSLSKNLRIGIQIHASVFRVGLDSSLYVGNGLVALYGKCGRLVESRRVLDEMPKRDVVSWSSLITGYARCGQFDDVFAVCREMEVLGVKPNASTMAALLPAVTNATAENVSFVEELFVKSDKDSVVMWNVMIAMYVSNFMPVPAVEIYSEMEACGIEPDAVTVASVLPACGDLSALMLGQRIHEYVERKRLRPNLLLENALIDMYVKCGCLDDARNVFDGMLYRDVVSWTSMISGYGMNGKGRIAVALFLKMLESGYAPDHIAFVSVISACSHAGLLDEGRYCYKLMTEEYKLMPRLEHCACMVDLFGRAGLIDEAYSFIKKMPIEPNERIWGALLSSCGIYSNLNIGLQAADHLFQLPPEHAGYYVLLSNMYAKAGRWEDVTTVRTIMKGKRIKKDHGVSNVELNRQVHSFLAGDQSHPQSKNLWRVGCVIGEDERGT